jgi:hypothetical protein
MTPQVVLDLEGDDEDEPAGKKGPDTRHPRRHSGDTNVGVVENAPAATETVAIKPMRDSHEILCPL